jgi:hypothetical protein
MSKNNNRNRNRIAQLRYNSLASMNVKSPLSSYEYVSKPCFCISSLILDNLPFKDFVVSAIINIPLVTRHLLASITTMNKDNISFMHRTLYLSYDIIW